MFVGTIKKDVAKALNELIKEGTVNNLVEQMVQKLIENTSIVYDIETKSIIVKFTKEI